MQRDWTKITLDEMLSLGIWRRVDQPATVYHLTDRANLDSIKADGAIKTGHDYICWFFESIENMWVYLDATGALTYGRDYGDYDGKEHHAPPIDPAQTVILKLSPRYPEPLAWYKEFTPDLDKRQFVTQSGEPVPDEKAAELREKQRAFDNSRIAHYKAMKFKRDYEVIELANLIEGRANA